jgi:large subunit ribosomal protein L25
MSKNLSILATPKTVFGKNANGRLRRDGLIPAVLYGEGREGNVPLTLNAKDFGHAFKYINLNSTIVKLTVEGQPEVEVLVKDYQFDPVRDVIVHVDLYQIVRDALVKTKVPLILTGVAIGIREGGTVVQHVKEIEVQSMKRFAPANVKLDIATLRVGEKFAISNIKALENVTFTTASDTVVVSVDVQG